MVKVPEMPIRQEKQLSSDFHMQMLRELEAHHDEKSQDWSTLDPEEMVRKALGRLYPHGEWFQSSPIDPKQLVHAANELTIAWAILVRKDALDGA